MKKIRLHLHKYIFYYVIGIIIFIIFCFILSKLTKDYNLNKQSESDFSSYEETVKELYKKRPDKFKFNNKGTFVIKVEDLLEKEGNTLPSIPQTAIKFTSEQDECVGYIIVRKKNNDINVDTSHVCDMIDF